MNNKTSLILLVFIFGMARLGLAQQSNGTYSFLDATNSARVAALGGISVPIYDNDIQLSTYNPSLISPQMSNHLALSYVDYYTDINFASVQYGRTFDKIGSFVGTLQYHNYGDFIYASESGENQGTFTASDYSFTLGWGRQLTDRWSIGANLKFAAAQYESYFACALAVDVAGTYRTENDWDFSLVARNVGIQLYNGFDSDKGALPLRLEAGMSKKLEHLPFTFMVVYNDIQKWDKLYDDPLDLEGNYDPITGETITDGKGERFFKNLASHFVVGGELELGKNLVLRGAYNYGRRHDMKVPESRALVGISYGVGVKIKMFEINYSRSRLNIVGSPNYISVVMDLDQFGRNRK